MNSEYKEALSFVLRLISKRDYTSRAIERKLKEKFPSINSEQLISYLVSRGFLDDERIACNYALSKAEKGWGRIKIKHKLIEKGIDGSVVERVLSEIELPVERIRNIVRKRFGEKPDRLKVRKFLISRGFTFEEIEKILSDKI